MTDFDGELANRSISVKLFVKFSPVRSPNKQIVTLMSPVNSLHRISCGGSRDHSRKRNGNTHFPNASLNTASVNSWLPANGQLVKSRLS